MDININYGVLEVICGSMFSGKSEELIRRTKRVMFANQDVTVFKHTIDARYSEEEIASHAGNRLLAIQIDKLEDIYKYIGEAPSVIGVDEIQFFNQDNAVEILSDLANRGHRVIVAGLDQDFRGEPFGQMAKIIVAADFITKLHAVCVKCGRLASRTQRIIDGEPARYDDPIVLVDASESYEARCRHCHEVIK